MSSYPTERRYSVCSLRRMISSMNNVVAGSNGRRNCLRPASPALAPSFCGNGVVEPGEICDCGFDEKACMARGERCCLPAKMYQQGRSAKGGWIQSESRPGREVKALKNILLFCICFIFFSLEI